MTSYGYIGLGEMGLAMTRRLLGTGAAVTVFDLDPAAVQAAVDHGAHAATNAAAVAGAADIVSICVPAAEHIGAVLRGPGGIHETARPGQILFIHSTVLPETVTDAATRADAWGVAVHDACVAGGAEAAAQGELVVLAGGHAELPPPAAELLAVYGSKVIDAGPVGAGAALKLGVNVMSYAQFSAAAASFDLVSNAGGSTDSLVAAWRHIGQLGSLTENYLTLLSIPAEQITGPFRDSLLNKADIADKDLALASELSTTPSSRHNLIEALRAAVPEVFGVAEQPVEGP